MHIIGFSHHYTKLGDQVYGELVSVRVLNDIQFKNLISDRDSVAYDTLYTEGKVGFPHFSEIGNDERLQLVFIGDKQIPFTTYRKVPKNYVPFRGAGIRTYRKSLPYSDLIGCPFAFKFKGEELPWGLASKISTRKGGCVKIFE